MKSSPPTVFSRLFFTAFFLFFPKLAISQLSQSQLKLTHDQQSQIQDLVARVLKHADAAGCKKACSILVANFTGETGQTSPLGVQLADEVSEQLTAQVKGFQIVSRHNLQQYLERERIPSKFLEDDNAARWLATENGATVVLIGYLKVGLTNADLHVQLLDTRDFGKREIRTKPYVEEAAFRDISNLGDTEPTEPFGKPSELTHPADFVDLHRSSPDSKRVSSLPRCTYKPDPSYTDPARTVKFQGTMLLQVVISKEGLVTDVQVLKGLPFGLNKQALTIVRTWRCDSATVEDKPVATMVPIEVSFRLY